MDSPSRNPLLLEQNNDHGSSEDESNDEQTPNPGRSTAAYDDIKETYRRSPSTPVDRYNFAYIAFYILGM